VGGAKRGTHTHGHTLACRARTQTPDRPEGGEGRECQGGEGGGQGGPAHVHGPCPRECIEGGLLRFRPGPSPYGCRWGPLAMRLGASGASASPPPWLPPLEIAMVNAVDHWSRGHGRMSVNPAPSISALRVPREGFLQPRRSLRPVHLASEPASRAPASDERRWGQTQRSAARRVCVAAWRRKKRPTRYPGWCSIAHDARVYKMP
jgi:hypothetical protein